MLRTWRLQIQEIKNFFMGEVCYKLCSVLMVNAEKFAAKLEKWGRCRFPIAQRLCVANFVFPIFSVFNVVHHE